MAAEQKICASQATGVADRMAEIQLGVALKQMKDAYERPEVRLAIIIMKGSNKK